MSSRETFTGTAVGALGGARSGRLALYSPKVRTQSLGADDVPMPLSGPELSFRFR